MTGDLLCYSSLSLPEYSELDTKEELDCWKTGGFLLGSIDGLGAVEATDDWRLVTGVFAFLTAKTRPSIISFVSPFGNVCTPSPVI